METIFISQDLWDIVQEGIEESPQEGDSKSSDKKSKEQKENVKRNASALRIIQQAVSKTIFPRIFGIKTAKEAWEVLKNEFQGSEKAISIKRQNLWRQFDNLAMKEGESIKDFHSRVAEIVNQIKVTGETIDEKKIVERILRSLTPKFEHVVAVIEETKDLAKLSMTELMGSLVAHEQRLSRFNNQPLEQAFQSKVDIKGDTSSNQEQRRRGGNFQRKGGKLNFKKNNNWSQNQHNSSNSNDGCKICKKSNHATKDCRFRCTRCKIQNHSQRDCWFQNKKEEGESNFAQKEEEKFVAFSCFKNKQKTHFPWVVDSGCSNHMTGNLESFTEIDDTYRSHVKIGDGKRLEVEGKGIILVKGKEGNKTLIQEVLYVPELAQNLLSVGHLMMKNYKLLFDNGECEIINKSNNSKVAKIPMTSNRLFPLSMARNEEVSLKSQSMDESFLWHLRYGHLNDKGLKLLKEKNMVVGLPQINKEDKVCEGYIYGKMHRLPFPKTTWRAKAPLELVHSDICGPTRTTSIGDKRYFLLFVDDYTRMMWVFFLEQKSEAFSKFLQFKATAEKESGRQIKTLRTDRGGEFIYKPFMEYCRNNGIKRQLTVRYTPQQNGVAERKNRTIVEMARSMMTAKKLPNQLWAEAVNTTIYILNRSPTKAVQNKTPFQAWHHKRPQVDNLKVFGCIAYAHISTPNRDKFDQKGEKLIFIGYSDESKGYRLYNPLKNEVVISRDVIFDEMAEWSWKTQDTQPSPTNEILENPTTTTPNQGDQNPNQNKSPTRSPNRDNFRDVVTDSDSPPLRVRSLRDIYESSHEAYFSCEPQTFEEAAKDKLWTEAMDTEISMIEKNKTWELVDKPKDKPVIGLKWVYKTKFNEDGSIQKHKARLVAKGYSQQPGIDFHETYAPVARMETIRTVIALAAQMELPLYQLDVKSAFLNGELEEEVYVEQPRGYEKKGGEGKVYRLRKVLYGLKQAPRAWNSRIDRYFQDNRFQRSPSEASLYIKKGEDKNFLILCLYVDDLIYTGTNQQIIEEFKRAMMSEFEMTDLGLMKYFLGIQVKQKPGDIFISQEKYTEDMMKRFHMATCKPIATPMALNEKLQQDDGVKKVDGKIYRSLVGSLIYLTHTRPDICHSVSLISRFMNEPSKLHFAAAKRILRYLQGTKQMGLRYKKEEGSKLTGYTDSDWAGSLDDRKSTSGYIFCLGTKPISWSSKKQKTVALSSAEAEYIAATDAACEAV
ncbi:Retrovirus-related Pol polyprotein from transposon TNT 1-94 [Linum grandiflorum]